MTPTIKTPTTKTTDAAAKEPENERDLAALRFGIMRKTATFLGHALICPDRRCRRERRCVGADMVCCDMPLPPVSEEEGAARLAGLQKALKRSLAEREPTGRLKSARAGRSLRSPARRRRATAPRPRSPRSAVPPSPAGR